VEVKRVVQEQSAELSRQLNKNIHLIQEGLHNTSDLIIRTLQIGVSPHRHEVAIVYIDGIVNSQIIRDGIVTPLLNIQSNNDKENLIQILANCHIRSESIQILQSVNESLVGISSGKTIVLIDGYNSGIMVDTAQWQQRSVETSIRQSTTRGPAIGFSEQLKVNINLIRGYIQSENLCVEMKKVGRFTKSDVSIIYLNGKVDEIVLSEIRSRIDALSIEYVFEPTVVQSALSGRKTIFSLTNVTELPDVAVSALYEGKVVVIMNGTPQAYILPNLFIQYLQLPNDYYMKEGRLVNRIIILFCLLMTILLPGLYLSIINFHQNWVPKKFAEKYFSHGETILPFFLEVCLLLFLVYILGLASLRIPKEMIVLSSLVGTLVISSTAVEAKLIHPLSLIIIGTTYLTQLLFLTGGMSSATITLRFIFFIIGNFLGVVAMFIGLILVIIYMSRLRSVGVPYLAPIIPFNSKEFKDVFYRGNLKKLINSKHTYPHDNDKK